MNSRTRLALTGGFWAGLIGYGTVVLFFVIVNVATGVSPFYTPALLGSGLFEGLRDPSALEIRPGPVLAYNMVHLLVFLALGMLASWLVGLAERRSHARYVALFTMIFVGAHLYAALLLFANPLIERLAWLEIGAPSVLAGIGMGWYLLEIHPRLRSGLTLTPIGAE